MHQRPNGHELERGEQAFGARQETEHDEAESEIVRLGQRVQTTECIGEAQQADGAGKEEKDAGADRDNAEEVNDKNSSAIRDVWSLRRRGAVDEGGGSEGREQRKPKRNIFDPLRARGPGDEKQRTDSPGADELRRHQAIGVAWAAQNAHEPDSHGEKDDARGGEKELSHRRPSG